MDYKQNIIDSLSADNWDEIIKTAKEAKVKTAEEGIFGIKKGFINYFRCRNSYEYEDIAKELEKYNCQCFFDIMDDDDEATLDSNKFIILFAVEENVFLHFDEPIIFFDIKHRLDTFYVENKTEKFKFKKISDLKAYLRDKQINSILDD
jgi:hypothetical protein